MRNANALRLVLLSLLAMLVSQVSAICVPYSPHALQADGYPLGEATSINSIGQVVGQLWWPEGDSRAVIWDSPASTSSLVMSGNAGGMISNAGVIAGEVIENHVSRAFIWRPADEVTYLDNENGNVVISGINSSGQVLGSMHSDNTSVPFIWTADTGFTELTAIDGQVFGINESGQVAGWMMTTDGVTQPFLWSSDTGVERIAVDSDWTMSVALNDLGQVAGVCELADGQKGIFQWSMNTGSSIVAQFGSSVEVNVTALNDSGTVVGSFTDNSESRPLSKAFAWHAGSGLSILGEGVAYDINDAGWIAGRLFDTGAVVWEPVPEPSSLLALLTGLGGLLRWRRQR